MQGKGAVPPGNVAVGFEDVQQEQLRRYYEITVFMEMDL